MLGLHLAILDGMRGSSQGFWEHCSQFNSNSRLSGLGWSISKLLGAATKGNGQPTGANLKRFEPFWTIKGWGRAFKTMLVTTTGACWPEVDHPQMDLWSAFTMLWKVPSGRWVYNYTGNKKFTFLKAKY